MFVDHDLELKVPLPEDVFNPLPRLIALTVPFAGWESTANVASFPLEPLKLNTTSCADIPQWKPAIPAKINNLANITFRLKIDFSDIVFSLFSSVNKEIHANIFKNRVKDRVRRVWVR